MPGGPQAIVAQFNGGRRLGPGNYVLSLNAAGMTDLAGNPLDERLYTPFPSISRQPGQPYIAGFVISTGGIVNGPNPYVPPRELLAAQLYRNRVRLLRR